MVGSERQRSRRVPCQFGWLEVGVPPKAAVREGVGSWPQTLGPLFPSPRHTSCLFLLYCAGKYRGDTGKTRVEKDALSCSVLKTRLELSWIPVTHSHLWAFRNPSKRRGEDFSSSPSCFLSLSLHSSSSGSSAPPPQFSLLHFLHPRAPNPIRPLLLVSCPLLPPNPNLESSRTKAAFLSGRLGGQEIFHKHPGSWLLRTPAL